MSDKCIRITIKTEPVAKGRAKTAYVGGMVRTYTPQKTRDAQGFIMLRLKRHQDEMFEAHVPVKLTCTFYRTKSKYLPRHETLPVRKPDTDNLLKLLLDSMNGVLVADDAQITNISTRKRWTDKEYGYITIKMCEDKLSEESENG